MGHAIRDTTVFSEFLKPFEARLTHCFPVSPRVNRTTMMTQSAQRRWRSFRLKGVSFREIFEDQTQRQECNESTQRSIKQILRASWLASYCPIPWYPNSTAHRWGKKGMPVRREGRNVVA